MIKRAQSILDFLSMFPMLNESDKNNGSELLMRAWDGPRDEYGNIVLPDTITASDTQELVRRGLIKQKWPGSRAVDVTAKGKKMISTLVLSEQSALETSKITKKSDNWVNKITKNGSNS